jgi:hypothetical protein
MHELVGLGHSMTHTAVGSCRDDTRTSEHMGISPAEEGWTVANDNEMYLVVAQPVMYFNIRSSESKGRCNTGTMRTLY